VDHHGSYLGVVALADLRIVMLDQDLWHMLLVNDLERQDAEPLTPHGNMNDAIRQFVRTGLDELPVVSTDQSGRNLVVGVVRRSDLVALYHRKILMAAAESVSHQQDDDWMPSRRTN
jgi:CBS domain-containing protein